MLPLIGQFKYLNYLKLKACSWLVLDSNDAFSLVDSVYCFLKPESFLLYDFKIVESIDACQS